MTVVDEFAERFDTLPIAYAGRSDYRVLVAAAALAAAALAAAALAAGALVAVAASVVVGQLLADDTIVLLGIELDLHRPEDQPD